MQRIEFVAQMERIRNTYRIVNPSVPAKNQILTLLTELFLLIINFSQVVCLQYIRLHIKQPVGTECNGKLYHLGCDVMGEKIKKSSAASISTRFLIFVLQLSFLTFSYLQTSKIALDFLRVSSLSVSHCTVNYYQH